MQANVNYLKCPSHKSQYIQMVCLTCSTNSLSCPLCLDVQHTMHQVISLKKFMSHQIPKLYKDKPNNQILMKNMDSLGLIFKQYIQKLRKQIGHQINQLQAYFMEKEDRIKQQISFICGEYNTKNLYENVEATKMMIKNKKIIPNEQEIIIKLKQIEEKSAQTLNDACLQIRKIVYKLKQIHNDSLDVLLGSRSFSAFQFCQNQKHPSIQIKASNMIAANKHFDNLYHCCVVKPPLSAFKNKITFSVKKSEHKCIWLGIADLDVIKAVKYENAYKGEGASYWLWEAGGDQSAEIYIQNSENKPLVGWNYQQGDKITLFLEYKENGKKILHFCKNNSQQFKFSTQVDPSIGSYYACINLGDQLESVQIISGDS